MDCVARVTYFGYLHFGLKEYDFRSFNPVYYNGFKKFLNFN